MDSNNLVNININDFHYEQKIENGSLVYYINGIRVDKYDLLAVASNETSITAALDIIKIADKLYGNEMNDYTYSSLRNCVYEKIMWEKCSKTELYYQSIFKCHVAEILGDGYKLVKKTSDNKNIPDAWVSYNGKIIPVEMKIGNFDNKALKQLLRYMNKYNTEHGIAIGNSLSVKIPENIRFIPIKIIKDLDKYK